MIRLRRLRRMACTPRRALSARSSPSTAGCESSRDSRALSPKATDAPPEHRRRLCRISGRCPKTEAASRCARHAAQASGGAAGSGGVQRISSQRSLARWSSADASEIWSIGSKCTVHACGCSWMSHEGPELDSKLSTKGVQAITEAAMVLLMPRFLAAAALLSHGGRGGGSSGRQAPFHSNFGRVARHDSGNDYDSMTVADLKELAEERGIKEPGVGWPVCCLLLPFATDAFCRPNLASMLSAAAAVPPLDEQPCEPEQPAQAAAGRDERRWWWW